jgi:ubiquinone/menaquinone biosynthesis C-methylase UbiE
MMSPKLYKSSHVYDFFMKLFRYESSIDRFLSGLDFDFGEHCRILDVGCGTGLLGLHFLERFPHASLVATDLEPNFLKATLVNAEKRQIDQSRMELAIADISNPRQLTSLDGRSIRLDDQRFDLICIGAALGYAQDSETTIRELLNLLAPDGYLINMEMKESLTGRFVAHRYDYKNIALDQMQRVMEGEGCEVSSVMLGVGHLPAMLTRIAVIARKSSEPSRRNLIASV